MYRKIEIDIGGKHPIQAELILPPENGYAQVRIQYVRLDKVNSIRQSLMNYFSKLGARSVILESDNSAMRGFVVMDMPEDRIVKQED